MIWGFPIPPSERICIDDSKRLSLEDPNFKAIAGGQRLPGLPVSPERSALLTKFALGAVRVLNVSALVQLETIAGVAFIELKGFAVDEICCWASNENSNSVMRQLPHKGAQD